MANKDNNEQNNLEIITLLKEASLENIKEEKRPEFKIRDTEHNKRILNIMIEKKILAEYQNNGFLKQKDGFVYFKILSVNCPKNINCFIFIDTKSFLERLNTTAFRANQNFFIKELNFFSETDNKDDIDFFIYYSLFNKLEKIIELISSDVKISSFEKIYSVFYGKYLLKINNKLSEKGINFAKKHFDNISKLLSNLESDLKPENISYYLNRDFFKKTLIDTFKYSYIEDSKVFSIEDILLKIENIFNDFELLKSAFLDTLNPEVIRENLKRRFFENLTAINALLTDLHSKTLFFPLSIIFALIQKISFNKNTPPQLECYFFIGLFCLIGIILYFVAGYNAIFKTLDLQLEFFQKDIDNLSGSSQFKEDIKTACSKLLENKKVFRRRLISTYILAILCLVFLLFLYFNCVRTLFQKFITFFPF